MSGMVRKFCATCYNIVSLYCNVVFGVMGTTVTFTKLGRAENAWLFNGLFLNGTRSLKCSWFIIKMILIYFRPIDVKKKDGISKTTARYAIRSGPKQFAAYLNGEVHTVVLYSGVPSRQDLHVFHPKTVLSKTMVS